MRSQVQFFVLVLTLIFGVTGLASQAEAHSWFKKRKLHRQYKSFHYRNFGSYHRSDFEFDTSVIYPSEYVRVVLREQPCSFKDDNLRSCSLSSSYNDVSQEFLMSSAQKVYVDDVKYYEVDGIYYKPVDDGFVAVDDPHVAYERAILNQNSCSVSSCE